MESCKKRIIGKIYLKFNLLFVVGLEYTCEITVYVKQIASEVHQVCSCVSNSIGWGRRPADHMTHVPAQLTLLFYAFNRSRSWSVWASYLFFVVLWRGQWSQYILYFFKMLNRKTSYTHEWTKNLDLCLEVGKTIFIFFVHIVTVMWKLVARENLQ